MGLSSQIRAALLADSGLSPVVGSRIYLNAIPQGATFPLVRFQKISTTRMQDHDGSGIGWCRYKFDAIDESAVTVESLADLIEAAMKRFNLAAAATSPATIYTQAPNFLINRYSAAWSDFDPRIEREIVDFKVWFTP